MMGVTQPARHGKTYAGLVVRDNNTRETLGQTLSEPLIAGQCYFLRFYASRSDDFSSYSRLTNEPADFTPAVRLQIWAGSRHCTPAELLVETAPLRDTSWQAYEVILRPRENSDQLFFTAAFDDPQQPYNGHLLLDHLSPIVALDCDQELPLLPAVPTGMQPGEVAAASLAELIRQEIGAVRWTRNGFSLYQELLPDPDQDHHWITGNPAVYRISRYLQNQPEALLTVAVGPRKDPLISHHIRLLAAEFLAAGLPPERCLIRPMKKRDRKRDNWLNSNVPTADLLWGISE